MRLTNFDQIYELLDFSKEHGAESKSLAQISEALWAGEIITVSPAEDSIAGLPYLVEQPTGDIQFLSDLHFEFFYSLAILHTLLSASRENAESNVFMLTLCKGQESRRKVTSKKLSLDFTRICLINLHNLYHQDILKQISILPADEFRQICYEFAKALAYVDATPSEFFELIRSIDARQQQGDLHIIATGMQQLCQQQPEKGITVLSLIEERGSDTIKGAIPAFITGLTRSLGASLTLPIVTKYLKSGEEIKVKCALFALSNFDPVEQEVWDQQGEAIAAELPALFAPVDSAYRSFLPSVYTRWFVFLPGAEGRLTQFSVSTDLVDQIAISAILWQKADDSGSATWFEPILNNAAGYDYSNESIYERISYCLDTITATSPSLAIRFLTRWVETESNDIAKELKHFQNALLVLFTTHSTLSQTWHTQLLRSEIDRSHLAVQQIVRYLEINNLTRLSLDQYLLSSYSFYEIKYILFKILGYVTNKEGLQSLTYSFLERPPFDERIAQLISNAFSQHICYNYTSSYSFLKEKIKTASPEIQATFEPMLTKATKYFEVLRPVREVNELKWLRKTGSSFTDLRMKKMREDFNQGMKSTEKNSIRSLFKNISMKGGKKFFSKYEGNYTQPVALQTFSSNGLDLPMGELIDPVKEILKRLQWVSYKMES